MRFIVLFALAPLALAGCMPSYETASASVSSANGAVAANTADDDVPQPQPLIVEPARPLASNAPLPPKRPDFEGVTPESRSIGAVVKDAEQVDAALEENAALPSVRTVALHGTSPAEDEKVAAPGQSFSPALAQPAAPNSSILYSGGIATAAARSMAPLNSPGYYAAYDDTDISCFPAVLRDALSTIAAHFGKPIEVTSGLRNRGRARSMHRYCMAADIRIDGVGPGALAAYAKSVDNVNGVGTYRYNTVTHIDVRQDKMAWRY